MSIGVMLFNPFTGKPRHPSDIESDPKKILVWDGEEPLKAYTPPAQRTWVGLTEQEALDCFSPNPVTHSKNVETKLKEKNQ